MMSSAAIEIWNFSSLIKAKGKRYDRLQRAVHSVFILLLPRSCSVNVSVNSLGIGRGEVCGSRQPTAGTMVIKVQDVMKKHGVCNSVVHWGFL